MAPLTPSRPAARRRRALLAAYLVLLALSHLWRALHPHAVRPEPGQHVAVLPTVDGERTVAGSARVVYRDEPAAAPDAPVLVLLHGSPGSLHDFDALARELAGRYRLVIPDLPGFGRSTRAVPDYSVRAHARYVLALLDELGIERAHVLGFSMGGGVALRMIEAAPERVRSLTLLSAIGVQELELLGDRDLNRLLHALQLAVITAVQEGFPHFGALDDFPLNRAYARNFLDTDQRPLRGVLERWSGPTLVLHGDRDFLVLPETAREHARIVPQAELLEYATSHFFVFSARPPLAADLERFLARVEAGTAPTRATAAPERRARAAEPFDPARVPPVSGPTLALLCVLIALATFVSEDLACIGAGLIVAAGRMDFGPATAACVAGIFVGDAGLYWAGRLFGRAAARRPPLAWLVTDADLDRAGRWFERRGRAAILASRFLPGTRLPTYFLAGVARTSFPVFALWFLVAALLWTPALVGLAVFFGAQAREWLVAYEGRTLPVLALLAVTLLLLVRLVVPCFTHRGRRTLVGAWRRWTRWEFWPAWLFYPPVVLWIAWLALRHRGLALMTCANPGIEHGGFVGESKHAILERLTAHPEHVARHVLLPVAAGPDANARAADAFLGGLATPFPVVLKPDVGQRGSGVCILRERAQLDRALDELEVDHVLQEYVSGPEFGIFYWRRPSGGPGHLFSIVEKRWPVVTGDGRRTVEELVLDDPRAVALWRTYLRAQAHPADAVPAPGEELRLVELGTHCRGAIFLDGERLKTDALLAKVDAIARGFDGFYFGRFDVRAESAESLARGEGFRILELNGLTSEAAHVYDPRHPLTHAWRVFFTQWRTAFEIAAENRARGARPTPLRRLAAAWLRYRRGQRLHRDSF